MKDYDYHSLFYYSLLVPLQDLRGGDGKLLRQLTKKKSNISFSLVWPYRDTAGLQHHYEHEELVANRDRRVIATNGGEQWVILMKVSRKGDEVTLYKKALRYLFKKNMVIARRELTAMLDKFYRLTIEEESLETQVDLSDDWRNAQHIRVVLPSAPREEAPQGLTGNLYGYTDEADELDF